MTTPSPLQLLLEKATLSDEQIGRIKFVANVAAKEILAVSKPGYSRDDFLDAVEDEMLRAATKQAVAVALEAVGDLVMEDIEAVMAKLSIGDWTDAEDDLAAALAHYRELVAGEDGDAAP